MFNRLVPFAAMLFAFSHGAVWAQNSESFQSFIYEAEDYTEPKDAWEVNKSTPNKWNLWSTDSDARQKWSGGVVLQSPVVKQDRNSPEEGAPPLHTHITGIPPGKYEVEIRLERVLAVSRDGKKWEKKMGNDRSLGIVEITDGTFDLWVDDRYALEQNPGSSYYDYLRFTSIPPRVDKPKVQGFAQARVRESLDRGLVAVRCEQGHVYLGWRLLESDPADVAFNVFRTIGTKPEEQINRNPVIATTDFVDTTAPADTECSYRIQAITTGSQSVTQPPRPENVIAGTEEKPYISIKLDSDETVQKVGIGDLDGDGRYDYVLKTPQDNIDPAMPWWRPSPDTYKLDAYSHDGKRLWRKDLGWSIERGIWYSPMIVFDLDGDGRAEVALKTGQGDPRGSDGRVETGPEWLSILNGATGEELTHDDWPSRETPGEKYNYNLASRNQICVAYLDGKTPCLIVERGTYTTIRLVAYQYCQKKLQKLWTWDSRIETGRGRYNGQGAHILHAADIDNDGRDEVIVGSCVVDDNGNGLWTTELGHPDFCFVGDIDPARPGLEIFYGIEPSHQNNGLCLVEAKTGKLLWGLNEATHHVGTDGMCADVDDHYPGSECHAADLDRDRKFAKSWLFSAGGEMISDQRQQTMSLPVYWDADFQRELVRGSAITDFNGPTLPPKLTGHVVAIADILGDWREEIITSIPGELRIYTTTIPAKNRWISLMQDPIYRIDVAVAFMGYYGTPMLSYDMASKAAKSDGKPE